MDVLDAIFVTSIVFHFEISELNACAPKNTVSWSELSIPWWTTKPKKVKGERKKKKKKKATGVRDPQLNKQEKEVESNVLSNMSVTRAVSHREMSALN